VEDLQGTLQELAAENGLNFELHQSITPDQVDQSLRILVALPPDPGLQSLAAAAPETQFLGIDLPGLEPGGNLSVISRQGSGFDRQGFLAGYIAALVTPDWRVGAISLGDAQSTAARQGFLNGAVFFCGLCRPTYPPYIAYPLVVDLPAGASPEDWQAAAETLKGSAVQTIYLSPGPAGESVLAAIAQDGVNLIGSASPPPALKDRWVATLSSDFNAALQQVWPDLMSGNGGAELSPSLVVSDINPDLLTPGRQRLVDELIQNLQAGFIDTGVNGAGPSVP
jgi:hypothetical protein